MRRRAAPAAQPCAERACGPERGAGSFFLERKRFLYVCCGTVRLSESKLLYRTRSEENEMTPSWECQSSLWDGEDDAMNSFDIFAEDQGPAAAGQSDDDAEWEALGWITECRT